MYSNNYFFEGGKFHNLAGNEMPDIALQISRLVYACVALKPSSREPWSANLPICGVLKTPIGRLALPGVARWKPDFALAKLIGEKKGSFECGLRLR